MEWSNHLKGIIDWYEASYSMITEAIFAELLIQDLKLTMQASLFGLSLDKGENFRDFVTRVERGSTVSYLSEGLKKEEIVVLCVLWAIPADLRSKVLQHFIDKKSTIHDLKLLANNLLASDHKIGGNLKVVSKASKSKVLTCTKYKKKGHEEATCRVRICKHCGKTGHLKETRYSNPNCLSFRGQSGSSTTGTTNVIQAPSHTSEAAHIIHGKVHNNQVDEIIEEVVGGQLLLEIILWVMFYLQQMLIHLILFVMFLGH